VLTGPGEPRGKGKRGGKERLEKQKGGQRTRSRRCRTSIAPKARHRRREKEMGGFEKSGRKGGKRVDSKGSFPPNEPWPIGGTFNKKPQVPRRGK